MSLNTAFSYQDEDEDQKLLEERPMVEDFLEDNLSYYYMTVSHDQRKETRAPLTSAPSDRRSERKDVKQRFVGVVTEVEDDCFSAEIRDLTNPNNPDEEVKIYLSEVTDNDKYLVLPGSVFNWYLGDIVERDYQKIKESYSKISFRRLPRITEEEFERASKDAENFAIEIKSNN